MPKKDWGDYNRELIQLVNEQNDLDVELFKIRKEKKRVQKDYSVKYGDLRSAGLTKKDKIGRTIGERKKAIKRLKKLIEDEKSRKYMLRFMTAMGGFIEVIEDKKRKVYTYIYKIWGKTTMGRGYVKENGVYPEVELKTTDKLDEFNEWKRNMVDNHPIAKFTKEDEKYVNEGDFKWGDKLDEFIVYFGNDLEVHEEEIELKDGYNLETKIRDYFKKYVKENEKNYQFPIVLDNYAVYPIEFYKDNKEDIEENYYLPKGERPMKKLNFKLWIKEGTTALTNEEEHCGFGWWKKYLNDMKEVLNIKREIRRQNQELLGVDSEEVSEQLLFEMVKNNSITNEEGTEYIPKRDIESGASAEDFAVFAETFGCNLYVVSASYQLIKKHIYSGKGKRRAVVGIMYDNHWYPISEDGENDQIRNSIIGLHTKTNKNDGKFKNEKEKKNSEEAIERFENHKMYLKNGEQYLIRKVQPTRDGEQMAINEVKYYLSLTNGNKYIINYGNTPVDMEKLFFEMTAHLKTFLWCKCENGLPTSFDLSENVKIVHNPHLEETIELARRRGEPFKNRSIGYYVKKMMDEKMDSLKYIRSSYNSVIKSRRQRFGYLAFYQQLRKLNEDEIESINGIDINKCYPAVASTFKDCYYVDALTLPERYDGAEEIKSDCVYEVVGIDDDEAFNMFKLTRWNKTYYFGDLLKYARERGEVFKIKEKIQLQKANIGEEIKEALMKNFEEYGNNLGKLLNCRFIGCLNRKTLKRIITKYVKTEADARMLVNSMPGDTYGARIKHGDVEFFKINSKTSEEVSHDYSIFWLQVIQYTWLKVMKQIDELTKRGHEVVRVDTDCIMFKGKLTKEEEEELDIDEEKIGSWKYEMQHKIEEKFSKKNMEFYSMWDRKETPTKEATEWDKLKESERENIREMIVENARQGKSFCVLGLAGTGKSYIINQILRIFPEAKLLSPTNKASRNVQYNEHPDENKKTLHKFFHIYKDRTNIKTNQVPPIIIVDEISMMEPDFYSYLYTMKLKGSQILMFGDYNQLPSVGYENLDMENAQITKDLCDNMMYVLTEIKRSGNMVEIYEASLAGTFDPTPYYKTWEEIKNDVFLHLVYTNELRMKINLKMNEYLAPNAPKIEYKITKKNKDSEYKPTPYVKIHNNMPIIVYQSDSTLEMYKNVSGVVYDVDEKEETFNVALEDGFTGKFDFSEYYDYFDSAWALTVHRVQSMSINQKYAIHEFDHPQADRRWKYTALSRATDKNLIQIVVSANERLSANEGETKCEKLKPFSEEWKQARRERHAKLVSTFKKH